jgi:hypothetical protein
MTNRSYWRIALLGVAIAAFALHFSSLRMSRPQYEPTTIEKIASGQSLYPYQYRNFLPLLASALHAQLPANRAIRTVEGYRYVFEIFFTAGLLVVFLLYLRSLGCSDLACVGGLLLLAHALIVTYLIPRAYPYYFVYDVPGVFFFTAGLWAMQRNNRVLFYLLYPLAVWNRETICFLTIVFILVNEGIMPRWKIGLHALAQALVWVAVKTALAQAYGKPLNTFAHLTLPALNIEHFKSFDTYVTMFSAVGYLWLPVLVFWRRIGHRTVKRSLLVCVPFAPAMFVVGNLVEIRIFGELIPLFVAGTVLILMNGRNEGKPTP